MCCSILVYWKGVVGGKLKFDMIGGYFELLVCCGSGRVRGIKVIIGYL